MNVDLCLFVKVIAHWEFFKNLGFIKRLHSLLLYLVKNMFDWPNISWLLNVCVGADN